MSFDVVRRAATALAILVLILVNAAYAKFEVAPGGVVVLVPPINGQRQGRCVRTQKPWPSPRRKAQLTDDADLSARCKCA